MVYEFGDNPQAAGRARVLGRQLIDAYTKIACDTGGLEVKREHADIAPVMYGWWRFLTRTASMLFAAEGEYLAGEIAPQMRVLMEYVYSMSWLYDHGALALRALEDFDWKQQSDLIKGLRDHGWPIAGQLDDTDKPQHTFVDEADKKLHGKILGEKNNFNNLVAAYGHVAIYDLYRFLCAYTHPSKISAYAYLQADNGSLILRDAPKKHDDADVIWATVMLLQAGNIVNQILAGEPLRKILDHVRMDLGVPKAYLIVRPIPS